MGRRAVGGTNNEEMSLSCCQIIIKESKSPDNLNRHYHAIHRQTH